MLKYASGRTTIIGQGIANLVPIDLDPVVYEGAWAYGSDGDMYRSDGVEWKSITQIALDVTANVFRVITAPTEITVGSGGDYPTLGAALTYFAGFAPASTEDVALGIIRILSGTTLAEQIQAYGANLGWIQIISDDATVNVDITGFSETTPYDSTFHFMAFANSRCPIIGTTFVRTGTNATATTGLNIRNSNFVTLEDPVLGVAIPPTSHTFMSGLRGFGTNLRVGGASTARLAAFELRDGTTHNLFVTGNSLCTIIQCRARQSTGGANLTIAGSSIATLQFTDYQRVQGTSASNDLVMLQGTTVNVQSGSLGGTPQPNLVPTLNGILYDQRDSSTVTWPGYLKPPSFTVATLPSAAANNGSIIYVTNGAAGSPCLAFSNGSVWNRVVIGATVTSA